jgi:hypothetical protein
MQNYSLWYLINSPYFKSESFSFKNLFNNIILARYKTWQLRSYQFYWVLARSPSDRAMALGSTQPLLKMSNRNISGGKGGRCLGLTTSPSSRAECHEIWELKPPGILWATPDLLRDSFTFTGEVTGYNFNADTRYPKRSFS